MKRRKKPKAKPLVADRPKHAVAVNRELLADFNSYGPPDWYQRGWYEDRPFTCVDCKVDEVWTATQQKWWYEVAKGQPFSFAKRCRACRRAKREVKTTARRRSGHE
jgi:hypothetical protein